MPDLYYTVRESPRLTRRSFVFRTMSLAAASLWSGHAFGALTRLPVFSGYPFQLGVASGDPSAHGFVLWTRLAPDPLAGGGMPWEPVEVAWQLAADESMRNIVRRGTAVANPDWAHSVHVELDGLEPDRWYWYQFKAGADVSAVGRTRTMPAAGTHPDRLRFAFASCQHWEDGFYTAYEHMAREDLDLVVHLGDYIYEQHSNPELRVRAHPAGEPKTLQEYRNRHALYKTDPALQAAHQMAPWIVTWDDHEVENNYASGHSEDEAKGVTPEQFLPRRAAAYQAYYEHMPLRRSSLPHGPTMELYRGMNFGDLAAFHVLDTRQYRSDQAYGDGKKPFGPELLEGKRTMLGSTQRSWLFDRLDRSPATWNVLAQQVMMLALDAKSGPGVDVHMDGWSGYEAERRLVINRLAGSRVSNPVVLTGDVHRNFANQLALDYEGGSGAKVGPEFVGTSISSGRDSDSISDFSPEFYAENPGVKFHNRDRGYVRCEIDHHKWRADYRTVESVMRRGAPIVTRRSFVVEAGQRALVEA